MNESKSFDLRSSGIVAGLGTLMTGLLAFGGGGVPRVEVLVGVGVLMTGLAALGAGATPPAAKPLSEVVASFEARDAGRLVSVEFDDGVWEAEAVKDGVQTEYHLDPVTGEVRRQFVDDDAASTLPPADGKPLSAILKSLEARRPGAITEVDFERGVWEVETRKDGRETKLDLDPRTGEPATAATR